MPSSSRFSLTMPGWLLRTQIRKACSCSHPPIRCLQAAVGCAHSLSLTSNHIRALLNFNTERIILAFEILKIDVKPGVIESPV